MTKWSEKPRPVESDYLLAIETCWREIQAVVNNYSVWVEEATRESDPLPWPLSNERTGDEGALLRWLAPHAVNLAIDLAAARSGVRVVEGDSADFQLVLRVVKRGLDAAEPVLRRDFGGRRGGRVRLDGSRSFSNWFKAFVVEHAGMDKALQMMGKSSEYRAIHRKLPGDKTPPR
jgi:hypothetical protein